VKAIGSIKTRKAPGPSEVNTEMVIASGQTGIRVLMELCQHVLDSKGVPHEWKTNVVGHELWGLQGSEVAGTGMKIVERVLERIILALIKLNDMQFGFMPGKGITDALFKLRHTQKEYHDKKRKLFVFCNMEKAFDRVPRKVMEWVMRRKELPEVTEAVMSLYEGAKMRVRVESGLSEEFPVEVGVHQGTVLSPCCLL